LILKTIEFHTVNGQWVKITEIPVLEEDNPLRFRVQARLQAYMTAINNQSSPKLVYSFREYLKRVLKWPEYEQLFEVNPLLNNA